MWYPAPTGTVEICIAYRDGKPFVRRSPVALIYQNKDGSVSWKALPGRFEPEDTEETEESFTALLLPSGDVVNSEDGRVLTWAHWMERVMEAFAQHAIEYARATDD